MEPCGTKPALNLEPSSISPTDKPQRPPLPLRVADIRHGAARWWIVGAAAPATSTSAASTSAPEKAAPSRCALDPEVEAAAARLGLRSGVRQQIFGLVATAEDAEEALLRLADVPEREEVVGVLWRCTLAERRFNPFYPALLGRLCGLNRKMMVR